MKTWVKVVLGGVAIALIVFVAMAWGEARRARLTGKAMATVTDVTLDRGGQDENDKTEIAYRFVVAGKRVESSDTEYSDVTDRYALGQVVTICYDPADPTDSDISEDPNAPCGAPETP